MMDCLLHPSPGWVHGSGLAPAFHEVPTKTHRTWKGELKPTRATCPAIRLVGFPAEVAVKISQSNRLLNTSLPQTKCFIYMQFHSVLFGESC